MRGGVGGRAGCGVPALLGSAAGNGAPELGFGVSSRALAQAAKSWRFAKPKKASTQPASAEGKTVKGWSEMG